MEAPPQRKLERRDVDDLTRNLELMEVIAASDALNNARTVLEETLEDKDEEWCEGIRHHVFPLLEAEKRRLDDEYHRLRGAS